MVPKHLQKYFPPPSTSSSNKSAVSQQPHGNLQNQVPRKITQKSNFQMTNNSNSGHIQSNGGQNVTTANALSERQRMTGHVSNNKAVLNNDKTR